MRHDLVLHAEFSCSQQSWLFLQVRIYYLIRYLEDEKCTVNNLWEKVGFNDQRWA